MHNPPNPLYDVVIAGAGPVGLFLACELRLSGVSVLVLEREHDPRSPLKLLPFGLRGLSAPTIEAFDRRRLLGDVSAKDPATAEHWMRSARRPGGHFAGIQFHLDRIDTSKWPYRLPGATAPHMAVTMDHLETILAARAIAMGADIRRGLAVEGYGQSEDHVDIRAGGDVFRGRWLVGCDGGRSAVRKAGGFDFAGTDPEFTGYSIEVTMADAETLAPGRHYTPTGMYTFNPPGTIAMVDFDGGEFHRNHPITREHVQAVLRRVAETKVTLTSLDLAATWTDRAYQATAYRNGRVLLAGDAAHTHSPLGGQGLNLGLGDAMNLGWKLAATIRGDAPSGLLDTYMRERYPVGAQILDWSRAQVALMRPSPGSRALASIIGDLVDTRDGASYFADRLWGLSLRYDLGGDHPLVGGSVPAFELTDGTAMSDLLADGKGVLLDFNGGAPLSAPASHWADRVKYIASDVRDRLDVSAVLVRPDGFVAWVGEAEPRPEKAAEAMSRWFGSPAA